MQKGILLFVIFFYALSGKTQTPCVGDSIVHNGVTYPCFNVELLGHLTVSELGGTAGNDIWGWTDPVSGREFAIVGLTNGTSFVEVTDPLNPVVIGFLPSESTNSARSAWRDMKVYKHYTYIVSEQGDHGIQIFDLKRLLTATPPVTFSEDALYDFRPLGGRAHNIVQFPEADLMMLVGTGGGIYSAGFEFLDVSNPLTPVEVGGYGGDGYCHDAVCFIYRGPDTDHIGKEICIGSNETLQTIVDVTSKFSPDRLDNLTYYDPDTLPGSGRKFYTHQSWVSDDHRFVFFNDEYDEFKNNYTTRTHVMNIEDLDNAVYLGFYDHGIPSIDHNCYVNGSYIFMSNYESGLQVVDFSNLTNDPSTGMNTIAYFDTYPQNESRKFNGTWSNYPYFSSGTIAVNDRNNGLFLLRLASSQAYFALEANKEIQPVCAGDDLTIGIKSQDFGSSPGNVTLSVSGLPAGATHVFTDPVIGSDDSTTLVVSNLPAGNNTYSIVISGNAPNGATHDYAFAFSTIPAIPSMVGVNNYTFSADSTIMSTDSIVLTDVEVDAGIELILHTPRINIHNNLNLRANSTLRWIEENVCAQN